MKKLVALIVGLVLVSASAYSAILVLSSAGTYSTKTSLSDAATAADAAGRTVMVTSVLTAVQSNISSSTIHGWPTDRALKVEMGGSINPTTTFRYSGDLMRVRGTGVTFGNVSSASINTTTINAGTIKLNGVAASATPGPNVIPVGDGSGVLSRGFIPDNVPGIISGMLTLYSSTVATTATINLGTLSQGDVFLVVSAAKITFASAPTYPYGTISQSAGTGIVVFTNSMSESYPLGGISATIVQGNFCTYGYVNNAGTVTIQNLITATGGTSLVYDNRIKIMYFKKQ